ncbi:MAG: putative endolysin [Siphoviridae sp. ct7UA22]|nr:MAG: putative endolysin [Siphoviridae sp. ct7UA22]
MKIDAFRLDVRNYLREFDLFSEPRLELLTMICAHESGGGKALRQIGGGPARGHFQIEKATHDSIWQNSDTIRKRALAYGIKEDFDQLEKSLRYNVFIAVHYLLMDPKPLPKGFIDMALYAKSYWNRGGKAEAEEYMRDFILWERGVLG